MAKFITRRAVSLAVGLGVPLAGVLLAGSLGKMGWAFGGAGNAPWSDASVPAPVDHAVVIVELFTSEGCSSCPPADKVLSRLVRDQPMPGIQVLGLGEHVDYWDRLGWRDPFSSPIFSNRQSEYQAQVFHNGSVYTPQLVVDGQFEEIGSDVTAVRRAIAKAAHVPKAAVSMAASPADAGHLRVQVQVEVPPEVTVRGKADVVIAVTQDHLATDVQHGENRGRKLTHSAVVRSLMAVGSLTPPSRTVATTVTVPVAAEWKTSDLRIIGFLQERESRRIIGAGSANVDDAHSGTWRVGSQLSQSSTESTRGR